MRVFATRSVLLVLILFPFFARADGAGAGATAGAEQIVGLNDKNYNNKVNKISRVFEASVKMLNDGRQEAYTDELSKRYEEMVRDINRGGDGHLYGEMPKFVPAKLPTLEDDDQ